MHNCRWQSQGTSSYWTLVIEPARSLWNEEQTMGTQIIPFLIDKLWTKCLLWRPCDSECWWQDQTCDRSSIFTTGYNIVSGDCMLIIRTTIFSLLPISLVLRLAWARQSRWVSWLPVVRFVMLNGWRMVYFHTCRHMGQEQRKDTVIAGNILSVVIFSPLWRRENKEVEETPKHWISNDRMLSKTSEFPRHQNGKKWPCLSGRKHTYLLFHVWSSRGNTNIILMIEAKDPQGWAALSGLLSYTDKRFFSRSDGCE